MFHRVSVVDKNINERSRYKSDGIQVYFSLCSFFPTNGLIKPTESLLRKALLEYGSILDISVKDYQIYRDQSLQEGYGFIWLKTEDDMRRMASMVQNMNYQGITISCSLTRQNSHKIALKSTNAIHHNIRSLNGQQGITKDEIVSSVTPSMKNQPLTPSMKNQLIPPQNSLFVNTSQSSQLTNSTPSPVVTIARDHGASSQPFPPYVRTDQPMQLTNTVPAPVVTTIIRDSISSPLQPVVPNTLNYPNMERTPSSMMLNAHSMTRPTSLLYYQHDN